MKDTRNREMERSEDQSFWNAQCLVYSRKHVGLRAGFCCRVFAFPKTASLSAAALRNHSLLWCFTSIPKEIMDWVFLANFWVCLFFLWATNGKNKGWAATQAHAHTHIHARTHEYIQNKKIKIWQSPPFAWTYAHRNKPNVEYLLPRAGVEVIPFLA